MPLPTPRRWLPLLAAALVVFCGWRAWKHRSLGQLPAIREAVRSGLARRREALGTLIVNLDDTLEALQGVPDDVVMAVPDPVTGNLHQASALRLRYDLGRTRETARQALLRCDEIQVEFDARARSASPGELRTSLAAIDGLPAEARAMLERR